VKTRPTRAQQTGLLITLLALTAYAVARAFRLV
jgi:hypothetical protein